MKEHPASNRSLTLLANGITLGILWILAAIGVLATGFSAKVVALAVPTGLVAGAIYSRERFVRRALAFLAFFTGLAISDHFWNQRSTFLTGLAVHAQFFAVGFTMAVLAWSAVRALRNRAARLT